MKDFKAELALFMVALFLIAASGGCRLAGELLNMLPVDIVTYTPRQDFVAADGMEEVTVRFSAAMNRTSVEQAFSLDDGSGKLSGEFDWRRDGSELVFRPHLGFAEAKRYTVAVAASAEDRRGNNIQRELQFVFRTGSGAKPPAITGYTPADGSVTTPEFIVISFSQPMLRDSVYRAFSISPQVAMLAQWNSDDSEVHYIPLEPLTSGRSYTVTLDRQACDRSGNRMTESHRFSFVAGHTPAPEVESVRVLRNGVELLDVEQRLINRVGVEKDDHFEIIFSAAVPVARRESAVSLSPALSVGLNWTDDFSRVVVQPLERLQPLHIYELGLLRDGRFRFAVDGEKSQPIEVEAVALNAAVSLGADGFAVLELADTVELSAYDPQSGAPGTHNGDIAIDFALSHAPDATISPASLMQSFRIASAGGTFTFAVYDVVTNPTGSPFGPSAGRSVVRFLLGATSLGTLPMDIVTIELLDGVRDDYHNRLRQSFRIEVNAQ